MTEYLEVWRPEGPALVPLAAERCSIGKNPSNSVALADAKVSHMHAVLERYPAGWAIRDLNSRNGTFVNGERLLGERTLKNGDEIRVGETRLVFKGTAAQESPTVTETDIAAPELTRRERDVLIALCRPVLSGETFAQPATLKEIAEALVVSEDAVKQHLSRMYDKFDIREGGARRVRLANEAIRRAAVTFADLRER